MIFNTLALCFLSLVHAQAETTVEATLTETAMGSGEMDDSATSSTLLPVTAATALETSMDDPETTASETMASETMASETMAMANGAKATDLSLLLAAGIAFLI